MEQFEIDEDETYEPLKRGSLFERVRHVTTRLMFGVRTRIADPMSRYLDPLHEGYTYFNLRYELHILKLGNPLVVKRLMYVAFVGVIIFFVTRADTSEGVNGVSGGAFSTGKFYDMGMLSNTLVSYIERESLQENFEYLSKMPHMAGTKGDLALARYVENYFSINGMGGVALSELDSFLNYPSKEDTYVRMGDYSATLTEGGDEMHELAFNPNSKNLDGDITAPVVFANYGDPSDFVALEKAGVKTEGTILLLRYGGLTPEPNKVLLALDLGAKAVVFITPKFAVGDHVIQRKNVGLWRYSPGDVLTPGWASRDDQVARAAWQNSKTTPKIPVIPISHRDGEHFTSQIKGGVSFDGKFSGTKDVQMSVSVKNLERKSHLIWDVLGHIAGREQNQIGIIFGAPRDLTCFGALELASGTAVLLELVKAFAALQRRYNWVPARSIYFVSFDATSYNLAGVLEWVEAHKQEIARTGYAFIDLSRPVSGDELSVKAHPLMHNIIRDMLASVTLDSQSQQAKVKTLYDLFVSQQKNDYVSNNMLEEKNYIPFVNTLNMPSAEISFKGDLPVGLCLDLYGNYEKLRVDPGMRKHAKILELYARLGLQLAEKPIIPFDYKYFGDELSNYRADLERHAKDYGQLLNFGNLMKAVDAIKASTATISRWSADWQLFVERNFLLEPSGLASSRRNMNEMMVQFGHPFVMHDTTPVRPGYMNLVIGVPFGAPAYDDGKYQWNSFPMVRDYMMKGDFAQAQLEIERVLGLLAFAAQRFAMKAQENVWT